MLFFIDIIFNFQSSSITLPRKGASMFIAIEGGVAMERWAEISRHRDILSAQLWNVSSGELNGVNRFDYENE